MGKIVRTYAAVTVYMMTYMTGLQDNVNLGVNLDGQEADVINVRLKFYISLLKSLIRISKISLQINANMHNLNRSQFSVHFLQTFF